MNKRVVKEEVVDQVPLRRVRRCFDLQEEEYVAAFSVSGLSLEENTRGDSGFSSIIIVGEAPECPK